MSEPQATPDPDLAALLARYAVTADGRPVEMPRGTAAGDVAWLVAEVQSLRKDGHELRATIVSLAELWAARQQCADCARLRAALTAAADALHGAGLWGAEVEARAALESKPS